MTRRRPRAALAAAAVLTAVAAGCGSATSPAAPRPAPLAVPGLATTQGTADGTWAVARLGHAAGSYNYFWELFERPAGSADWRLATPPGVASNGGLVLAALGGQSALAGFLPSQDLLFSPLPSTTDGGRTWSTGPVLPGGLADVTGALAAEPDGSRFLALFRNGQVEQAGQGASAWRRLTSIASLAASPAGRRCAPRQATAVAFSLAGDPLLAVACTRPGPAGIFSYRGGTWQAAGPATAGAMARRRMQVLLLTRTGAGELALLAGRQRGSTGLVAAWSANGTTWTVSAPLGIAAQPVRAAGSGEQGQAWVLLGSGQAYTIAGQRAAWRLLPRPPAGTAALAVGPAGSTDALAGRGKQLTDWRLAAGAASWRVAQSLHVPLQYGSSS